MVACMSTKHWLHSVKSTEINGSYGVPLGIVGGIPFNKELDDGWACKYFLVPHMTILSVHLRQHRGKKELYKSDYMLMSMKFFIH